MTAAGTHYIRAHREYTDEPIPRATARDVRLSFRALGILVRILTNADGFPVAARSLSREGDGREGRDAVTTALRELEDAGYIRELPRPRNAAGQFRGREMMVHASPQEPSATHRGPENPVPGFPVPGNPALKSSKNSKEREKSSSKHARARAPSPPSAADAAAATRSGKQYQRRPSGIECWTAGDPEAAERIEAEQPAAAIAAAVAQICARGRSPAPGAVVAEIRRQEAAVRAAAAEREQHRRAVEPCEDAATRARMAAAHMAQYMDSAP